MRIVFVAGALGGRGGIERSMQAITSELERRGHTVRLVLLEPPRHAAFLGSLRHTVLTTRRRTRLGSFFVGARAVQRELRAERADIAVGVDPVVCAMALAARVCPVASWLHFDHWGRQSDAPRGWSLPALRGMIGHLAVSCHTASNLARYGPSVQWIGNPVGDPSAPLAPSTSGQAVAYCGRMSLGDKRPDLIVRAVASLHDPVDLYMVGDGKDRAYLMEYADRRGIGGQCHWTGWREDPWSAVPANALVVLASAHDLFPMVILEAHRRGLPVLASDCPTGPREIIHPEVNGWLVQPDDEAMFQQKLAWVLGHPEAWPDKSAIVATAMCYDVRRVVDRFESALDRWLRI